ncbi:cysteine peptidase family C39 domain-containing protein [Novipirellula artificiosorum]|uniref:Peptidase C39 family protein n=1 Tax=Novipirellula artificiosorum TaxID=2528016 RepID=A0A5C6DSG7_9BACT|nr:cysteine peptidase family C39 domain-containing protein [Novipirellula artificiosorum]TWU38431.1 Peptidase C39 family protein [Novipirellula artificiosorum]
MTAQHLEIEIQPQPSETSCGPTCLAAVYQYWNRAVPLDRLITEIGQLDGGGTLAVELGCDALRRGFTADIVTYNLQLFDPTWFDANGEVLSRKVLASKLRAQQGAKSQRDDVDQHRLTTATEAYLQFLTLGGRVRMQPLDDHLIIRSLSAGVPILCGLSATYLYHESRERSVTHAGVHSTVADDIEGDPTGHFVVLHGYCPKDRVVRVADPLHPNPMAPTNKYIASLARVASAILLGIITFDANLLTIQTK